MFDDRFAHVNAWRTPSAQNTFQKRQGARKVKELEHATNEKNLIRLTPQGASVYRALSARCNYLAQDRVDLAYSAKELCRDVAVPSTESLRRLKRMLRYLKGAPGWCTTTSSRTPRLSWTCMWTPILQGAR